MARYVFGTVGRLGGAASGKRFEEMEQGVFSHCQAVLR
jgi:hypothetical protein